MKITAFNGSPRAKESNTDLIVKEVLQGAKDKGAQTDNVFLARTTIQHCTGCFHCWVKQPGQCWMEDDMSGLIEKFMGSDLVILATPLHFDQVTSIMKTFIDRLIPLESPPFEEDQSGLLQPRARYNRYPFIVPVINGAFLDLENFKNTESFFHRLAGILHTEIRGMIIRPTGEILKEKHPSLQADLQNYFELLRDAGAQLALQQQIEPKSQDQLTKALISRSQYIAAANTSWQRLINENQTL